MSREARWAIVLATLWAVPGCSGSREPTADGPLRIAAAADLRVVLPRLLTAYGDQGSAVAPPSFGASGDLAEQIRGGAPFDVFLSADLDRPKALEAEGLMEPGSVAAYARGSLVLLVHPDVADAVADIFDLTKPEVRKIAIADPQAAPYGQAARAALGSAGLWDSLQAKIVPAGSVAKAVLHVEQGDADAALVSRSLIAGTKTTVVAIDQALYPPRIQGLGIVADSPRKDRARDFTAFLLGGEGRRVLIEHGFEPPDSPTERVPRVP